MCFVHLSGNIDRSGESGDIKGQGEEFWEVREWAVVLDAEREERGTEARLQWVEL